MKIKYIISLLLVLVTGIGFAADLELTATVNKSTVAAGERFEVSFTINGNIDDFNPPAFTNFRIVSGPNQSSSMTSVNGRTTVSIGLSYILVAVKEGTYTIGAATVKADGNTYTSDPIHLKVTKGNPGAQGGQSNSRNTKQLSQGNSTDISKRLFIRAVPSKSNVYQGEQLVVTYKLYTNVNLVDISLDKLPVFNGFWSQEIKADNQQVAWTQETINGSRYHVAELKQMILFPERSGKLKLDPLVMSFLVRQTVASNDPIEQFFGGSYEDVKYEIKSPVVNINVKPLPEEGKPTDFQGAVGNFSIQSSLDKTELKANEALNYRFKVTGSGNLKLLQAPVFNVPADIEKYDPKITDHIEETAGGVSGTREYTYVLIPRHEGQFKLTPLTFSYFNPAKKSYVTLKTEEYALNVAKGDPGANVSTFSGGNQQDVKLLDKDIRYIKNDADLDASEGDFYDSWWFWFLLLLAPVSFVLALFYRNRYRAYHKDLVKVKGKQANKIATKHMANAKRQLLNGDKKLFYEAVYKGLYGYLSDKFNIAVADLNKDNISQQLRIRNIDEQLISQLADTIDLCEMARYAPITGIAEQEVFEKAKTIINDIENAQS